MGGAGYLDNSILNWTESPWPMLGCSDRHRAFPEAGGTMESLLNLVRRPWPWWVAGPAIGLFVTAFAALTGNAVAVSGGFGSACARLLPSLSFFRKSSFAE